MPGTKYAKRRPPVHDILAECEDVTPETVMMCVCGTKAYAYNLRQHWDRVCPFVNTSEKINQMKIRRNEKQKDDAIFFFVAPYSCFVASAAGATATKKKRLRKKHPQKKLQESKST